jgi:hypothetical protein
MSGILGNLTPARAVLSRSQMSHAATMTDFGNAPILLKKVRRPFTSPRFKQSDCTLSFDRRWIFHFTLFPIANSASARSVRGLFQPNPPNRTLGPRQDLKIRMPPAHAVRTGKATTPPTIGMSRRKPRLIHPPEASFWQEDTTVRRTRGQVIWHPALRGAWPSLQ